MRVICLLLMGCSLLQLSAQEKYTNPILAGFYPDPSICRVADDYYLVNSSFSFFPGLPLFHSKDLVHWEQIANAIERPEQVDFDGLGISEGIFAPTLRYHDGRYYIICTVVGGIGNFVITATSPAGPWSMPTALPYVEGMDPDLFFDEDGKAYVSSCAPGKPELYSGHRAIMMHEFYPESLTTSVEAVMLVDGGADRSTQPIWCEGPHLFKKDGYYYLICAEGGTSIDHSEVVFRSKSLDTPFEPYAKNPILTQRTLSMSRPHAVTNTGHGDIVQTPDGQWWTVFLGCRPYDDKNTFNTGRETFLLPVHWQDEWPVILAPTQQVALQCDVPDLGITDKSSFPLNGNFDYTEYFTDKTLPLYMLHIRTPQQPFYTCGHGLSLDLQEQTMAQDKCPSFVGRRQQHTVFESSVSLAFQPKGDNEIAGLAAFQNDACYYLLAKTTEGFALHRGESGEHKLITEINSDHHDANCFLKMTGDDTAYHFYFSHDNTSWVELGDGYDAAFLSTSQAGGFVGTIVGAYASSNGEKSRTKAHYKWMRYIGVK